MLQHLLIRNFAIVPFLEQDFSAGFTAISGETGAGKSILVDALGLLLGERSDSTWVKPGEGRAELTAEFSVAGNEAAAAWLAEHDLREGDSCLLRRTIQAGGRSRAWVNGTPVTVQQLATLGGLLVELHGQNEHLRLTGARRQLELLDETGDYRAALEATASAFERWRAMREQYLALEQAAAISESELEFLRFQFQELQTAAVPPDQVRDLENELRLLARAGDLLEALGQATERIELEDTGLYAGLNVAIARLQTVRELDPDIDAASQMLEEARINCQEALGALRAAGQKVDLNPGRLADAERQLSELNALARKHRVEMEELPEVRDELERRLLAAENFEEQREALERGLEEALEGYRAAAQALSGARQNHAGQLASAVSRLMAELGMAGGVFSFEFSSDGDTDPSMTGDDRISIMVSANPGIPPGPLSKIASGGELSRISLAVKAACSGTGKGRTQIFDEIDAGIGGETANAVGRLLQSLAAAGGQALCVTHLAQVAARADHQLRVSKQAGGHSTDVDARVLDTPDRVDEIARMLGGTLSEQSRAHAREMLEAARESLH